MLIRAEQMSVFERAAEDNFVRRIAAHLLENYVPAIVRLPDVEPATVGELPPEKLHSLVEVSVERARRYGLTYESSIAAFSALMFEVAPNFDSHRLIKMLLNDENIEPEARLNELLKVLNEKNWEAIRGEYDIDAWQSKAKSEENADSVEKPAGAKNSEFAETVMNAANVEKTKPPAAMPNLDFDETVMSFEHPKSAAKTGKAENFDFPDTVLNINTSKE